MFNKKAYQRKWKEKHPTYNKKYQTYKYNRQRILKRKYGLTVETYEAILKEQKECCKICGRHKSEFKRNLAVDHCHKTNRVRGLLCHHCNAAIGHLFENTEIMERAISYIKESVI